MQLIISPKMPKGKAGYRSFSIRVPAETACKLDDICGKTGYTRNALIGLFLEYAIEQSEIAEQNTELVIP